MTLMTLLRLDYLVYDFGNCVDNTSTETGLITNKCDIIREQSRYTATICKQNQALTSKAPPLSIRRKSTRKVKKEETSKNTTSSWRLVLKADNTALKTRVEISRSFTSIFACT